MANKTSLKKKGSKDGFRRLEKLIDGLAIATAKGFEETNKKIDNLNFNFNGLKTETEQNFKKLRKDILDIGDRFVPRLEFDNLLIRFSKLEQKVREKLGK